MTKSIRSWRCWLLTALALITSGSAAGCNPQMLNFLLMPFVDDREQPRCKLACADKKELTVAIVSSFAGIETRTEMMTIESELSDRLAMELRKLAKDNKEKLQVVPTAKVRSILNQDAGGTLSRHEIGQKLKADFVINLDINGVNLYEKGSSNTLYRAKAEIAVACVDVSKPRGEGIIFSEPYSREYPGARYAFSSSEISLLEFRTQFLSVIAQDLACYFLPHQAIKRMD